MDITHCDGILPDGTLCPIRDLCRRHDYFREFGNAGIKRYGLNTSFMKAPYSTTTGDCKYFLGDFADRMFHKLENILGIKIRRVPFGKLAKLVKPKKIGYKQSQVKKKSVRKKK